MIFLTMTKFGTSHKYYHDQRPSVQICHQVEDSYCKFSEVFPGALIRYHFNCCTSKRQKIRRIWCFMKKWSESCSVMSESFGTPWTIESLEFSKPEYWSGKPFPSPGDLPNPRVEPRDWTPELKADSLPAEPQGKPDASWGKSTRTHRLN